MRETSVDGDDDIHAHAQSGSIVEAEEVVVKGNDSRIGIERRAIRLAHLSLQPKIFVPGGQLASKSARRMLRRASMGLFGISTPHQTDAGPAALAEPLTPLRHLYLIGSQITGRGGDRIDGRLECERKT